MYYFYLYKVERFSNKVCYRFANFLFRMNVEEAFRYLEELEEDDTESQDIISASVFLSPPVNEPDEGSDEDSGDEEIHVHNLGSRQLRAEATVSIQRRNDVSSIGEAEYDVIGPSVQNVVPKWVKRDLSQNTAQRVFPWTLPSPTLSSSDCPTTFFEKFFSEDLLDSICSETNRYAATKGKDSFRLDARELKLFLALLLASGYVRFPRKRMFWETAEDVSIRCLSEAMSRNRFEEILRYLHLADNSNLDTDDKFAKVRPMVNHINEQCKSNFIPEQNISIDESMIPYHGKHGAKQYMHGKPIPFGYKAWAAATRLGYVIALDLYQGKSATVPSDHGSLGVGGSVVCKLVQELPDHDTLHYHIVIDNFFTSIKLLNHLKDMGIAATGTLRANRDGKAPLKPIKQMDKEPRGTHEVVVDTNSNVCLTRWKDNKTVTVASTFTGLKPVGTTKRYVRTERQRKAIPIPKAIQVYNQYMGGIDRFDQNVAYYMTNIRSKKWWWPIFRFLLDLAVQNAFQLYRLQQGVETLDLLGFRRSIVITYLQK